MRADDEMLGAWWIGRGVAASAGKPVTLGFAARFSLPLEVPSARLTLRADAEGEAFFDGVPLGRCGGRGEASPTEVWDLAGPLSPGPHEIAVFVSHPEGVAALRAGLDADRIGRNCVVTDSAWRVDDDAKRIRERGFDGARYPATLFGTPPLSSWGISSSRAWRGRVAVSKTAVSSRIP